MSGKSVEYRYSRQTLNPENIQSVLNQMEKYRPEFISIQKQLTTKLF